MAKKENRHFPVHPVKTGKKVVSVKGSEKQSPYKRTNPRHHK